MVTIGKRVVAALDKLHAKHVLPGFADRSAEEREIEAATTDITKVGRGARSVHPARSTVPQDFRRCQALIQRIEPTTSFPPTAHGRRNDALAAKNTQRGLAAKVQELSATFRKKQRVYMESTYSNVLRRAVYSSAHLCSVSTFPELHIRLCALHRCSVRPACTLMLAVISVHTLSHIVSIATKRPASGISCLISHYGTTYL